MRKTRCKVLKKQAIEETGNKKSTLLINRKTGDLSWGPRVRRAYQDLKRKS